VAATAAAIVLWPVARRRRGFALHRTFAILPTKR
jgi:hypothetical protein